MYDVFISYSHKDKPIADAVCARFESDSIRCWYAPRDIAPGADREASVTDAIKEAKVMVLIFTDSSNASEQVLREVISAASAGIPIVPFKLTETLPTKGMQYYLATVHWLDAMNLPLQKSIADLEERVKAILSAESPFAGEISGSDDTAAHKKKKWLIPVIAAAAAVVIGVSAAVYFLTSGSSPAETADVGSTQTGASEDISSTDAADAQSTQIVASGVIESTDNAADGAAQNDGEKPNDGSEYLPLTPENVMFYTSEAFSYDFSRMEGITVGDDKNNAIHIRFTIGDSSCYYLFDKETGEVIDSEIEGGEPATVAQGTGTSGYSKEIEACKTLLTGLTAANTPKDIRVTKVDGSPDVLKITMTFEGIYYEFLYDRTTEKATQLKP